jgi:glutamate dehydrogenase
LARRVCGPYCRDLTTLSFLSPFVATPRYIVEGANLFITEDARDVLEKAGIILYKDASTNKGGVTSSSFEVLASLCMADEEHEKHMRANAAGDLPAFYQDYVQEIIAIVEENARLEFEAVHKYVNPPNLPISIVFPWVVSCLYWL